MTSPAPRAYRIGTQEDFAYEKRHWPTTRYTATIDGEYLKRKDGGLRKFKTRHAARMAAHKMVQAAKLADAGSN